jgi:hypothetical protein
MPRVRLAYLSDIIEACDAIASALRCADLDEYGRNGLVRWSVEREFLIIVRLAGWTLAGMAMAWAARPPANEPGVV